VRPSDVGVAAFGVRQQRHAPARRRAIASRAGGRRPGERIVEEQSSAGHGAGADLVAEGVVD